MAVPSNWKPPSTPKELWFKGHGIIFQFVGHKLGHNIEMIIVSTLFVIISKAHNFFYTYASDHLSRFIEGGNEKKCSAEIKMSCLRYFSL